MSEKKNVKQECARKPTVGGNGSEQDTHEARIDC